MSISPDDPRLTEYALGEMDGDAAKNLESSIAENPAAFDEIHEIRGAADTARKATQSLPVRSLTDTQRHRILRLADAPAPESLTRHPTNVIRPAFWGWFGKFTATAAAAAIAAACLILAYQSGYRNAVVDAEKEMPPKGTVGTVGTVTTDEPRPGETPSIRIHVVDEEGEPQQIAQRPLSPDSVLPVGKGKEDAIVSSVPQVHGNPNNSSDPGTGLSFPIVGEKDDPEQEPVPEGRLPVAVAKVNEGSLPPSPVMENPFVEVNSSPRSSFPLRAGADAYASAAGSIRGARRLPDPATIAVEEIVNAFTYSVPGFVPSASYEHPFAVGAEVFSCPWNVENRLVRVTIRTALPKDPASGEPEVIAEDIELLVEFNRSRAARYRLIGFDGAGILSAVGGAPPKARALHAGESVTALYEVVPSKGTGPRFDLRYAPHKFAAPPRNHGHELLCLSISYKDATRAFPGPDKNIITPVIDDGFSWNRSSGDFQFAAAAAAFGMILSGSEHTGEYGFEQIHDLAERALENDKNPNPRRTDFLDLLDRAARISNR